MNKKTLNQILSQRGVTLLEVIIAFSLLTGLSVMFAKLTQDTNKQIKTAELRFNGLTAIDKIYRDLSSGNICSTTFTHGTPNIKRFSELQDAFINKTTFVSEIYKYKKPNDNQVLNTCNVPAFQDNIEIEYPSLNLTKNGGCKKALDSNFAIEEKWFGLFLNSKTINNNPNFDTEVKKIDASWAAALIISKTLRNSLNTDELQYNNNIVEGVKFKGIKITEIKEGPTPNSKFVKILISVDIRGENEGLKIYGSPIMSKEFTLKINLSDFISSINNQVITSCFGDFSEDSAVEKACFSLGGEYSGGICNIPKKVCHNRRVNYAPLIGDGKIANFRRRSIETTKTDELNESNIENDHFHLAFTQFGKVRPLVIRTTEVPFVLSSTPYSINPEGLPELTSTDENDVYNENSIIFINPPNIIPSDKLKIGKGGPNDDNTLQNSKYIIASMPVCNENEHVINATSFCTTVKANQSFFDMSIDQNHISQIIPSQISQIGQYEFINNKHHPTPHFWTVGCLLPGPYIQTQHFRDNFNFRVNALCCEK